MPSPININYYLKKISDYVTSTAQQSIAIASGIRADVLLGGSLYKRSENEAEILSLARFVPTTGSIKLASAHFLPHGLAYTRGEGKFAYAFEKIGSGAGLFDLEKMQLVERITPVKGRLFYGHGVCSADDKLLYTTETSSTGEGAIGVRETNSQQYLGDFPSYGNNPHDCHLLENGSVLAVANGGGAQNSKQRASVCYIDVQSQRLLERVEMPDKRFNAGHFHPLTGHQFILVSAPRGIFDEKAPLLGAISIRMKSAIEVLKQPSEIVSNMLGETLSVLAIPSMDMFIATHPLPGMVTVWQLSSRKFLHRIDLPMARGLVLTKDKKGIWITYGTQAQLVYLNLTNMETSMHRNATYITGSHLYMA